MEEKAMKAMEEARSSLISSHPSLGYLSFKLRWFPDPTCRTAWTDGVSVGYNPAYVMSLTRARRKFLVAHEVGHPMLGHHLRRGGRDNTEWNIACDHAVNLILRSNNFDLIENALLDPQFINQAAEEIHEKLFGSGSKQQQQGKGGKEKDDTDGRDSEVGEEPSSGDTPEDSASDPAGGGSTEDSENSSEQDQRAPGEDRGPGGESGSEKADHGGSQQADSESGETDGAGDQEDSGATGQGGKTGEPDPSQNGSPHGQPGGGSASDMGEDGEDPDPGGCGEVRDFPGENGEPTDAEVELEAEKWDVAIQQAAQIARKLQGDVPGFVETILTNISDPKLPWREILARWFSQKAKTDYNMARPNPRYAHTGFFMPSLDNENLGKVAIFWDTSCSVTDSQAADICAETQGLLSHYPGVEVELFHIDTAVRHIEPLDEATNWEDIRPKGRGGTDFRPGFDFLEEDDEEAPIGVIYMTDGECTKFPETPPYPVLWIVVGMGEYERFEPPFGEVAYYTDY